MVGGVGSGRRKGEPGLGAAGAAAGLPTSDGYIEGEEMTLLRTYLLLWGFFFGCCWNLPVADKDVGMLDQVDVEVDGAVDDGQDVGEVGHDLHPVGPLQDLHPTGRVQLEGRERGEELPTG